MLNYDPYSPEAFADPYPIYKRLRDEAPCYFIENRNTWAVSRFQDVWDAHLDTGNHTATNGTQPWDVMQRAEDRFSGVGTLHFYDQPQHTQLSEPLVRNFFGSKAINRLHPQIEQFAQQLVDEAYEKGSFDLVHDITWPLAAMTTMAVCGLPKEEWDYVRKEVYNFQHRNPEGGGVTSEALHAVGRVVRYLAEKVKERRAAGFDGDSMIDMFGTMTLDGESLGDDNSIAMQMSMFVLGGSSQFPKSSGALYYRLFKNADQRAAVIEDMDKMILPAYLEALRIDNPTNIMGRVVTKEHQIHGQTLEPGQGIIFLYAAAGRDEREFPEPDVFNIHRNPKRTVSFGIGHHKCIGRGYGMHEARVLTKALLTRMPNYVIDESQLNMFRTEYMRGWENIPTTVS